MNTTEVLSPSNIDLNKPYYQCEYNYPSTLEITFVEPVSFEKRGEIYYIDFGKAAWGNLQITFDTVPASNLLIRLGEKLDEDGTIDRDPPGSVNFQEFILEPQSDKKIYQLNIPTQWFHDNDHAVKMPAEIGEVTIFRYVEIEGLQEEPAQVRQLFVHAPFDDEAAYFQSSSDTLNAVWELCKYTMKATTAFGVYIDGERERIPYEADAYLNQLSHLACDLNPAMARASLEYLLENPTWPTEWSFHTIMMAAADFEVTGESTFAAQVYEKLKAKLLMDKAGEDGLLHVGGNVDWPPCERDNYNNGEILESDPYSQLGPEINTVANAFYFHALERMAFLAGSLGKENDRANFQRMSKKVYESFNGQFFDAAKSTFIDGVSADGKRSDHVSLHANMFALAFGLVPRENEKAVADYVESRGMACSVYGAQYLLEALFRAERDEAALRLMTAKNERSWWHMIELGSTMTLEAWDEKYKPNLTWSHAWGAVPINIVARYVLGVRPLFPGYTETLIAPQPGTLEWANGSVPTPLGVVEVSFHNRDKFSMEVTIPDGMIAKIQWPKQEDASVEFNGVCIPVSADENRILAKCLTAGHHVIIASERNNDE